MGSALMPRSAGPQLLVFLILTVPVLAGLAGTIAPALGFLPALGGTGLSLTPITSLLAQPNLLQSSLINLLTGLASTVIALMVVMLFVAGFSETRAFRALQHLVSPLLAVPHAAAAFGLVFLIAPSGLLLRLISPELTGFTRPPDWLVPQDPLGLSMMAGLVIKEIPFLFLVTLAALPQVPVTRARQLMTSLGYGQVTGFLISLGPAIYRQIRLPVLAVLAYSTSVVDVAMILGPTLPAPLSVRVTQWMADSDLNLRFLASAGAVLQVLLCLVAMGIWVAGELLAARMAAKAAASGRRMAQDGPVRALACGAIALSAGLVFLGILVLALWSVAGLWQFPAVLPEELSLRSWMRTLPRIVGPLATTVSLAAVVSAIALLLAIALLAARPRHSGTIAGLADTVLYLPLLVPQLAFIFGLQLLVVSVGLDPHFLTLVFVHLIFVLPYVILSLSPPWRGLDERYELVAAGLGASPVRILLRIRLPMLLRALLTAFAIGFATSVGLYLPTALIGAGRLVTITTEAVALSSGGDRRVIGVYALLQSLLPFAGFLIVSIVPQLLFRNRRAMRR